MRRWPLAVIREGFGGGRVVLAGSAFTPAPVADDLAEVVGDGPQVQFDVDLRAAGVDGATAPEKQLREQWFDDGGAPLVELTVFRFVKRSRK